MRLDFEIKFPVIIPMILLIIALSFIVYKDTTKEDKIKSKVVLENEVVDLNYKDLYLKEQQNDEFSIYEYDVNYIHTGKEDGKNIILTDSDKGAWILKYKMKTKK